MFLKLYLDKGKTYAKEVSGVEEARSAWIDYLTRGVFNETDLTFIAPSRIYGGRILERLEDEPVVAKKRGRPRKVEPVVPVETSQPQGEPQ